MLFRNVVRFKRKHRCLSGALLIIFGLLLMIICVPGWALMALLGLVIIGVGAWCLFCF